MDNNYLLNLSKNESSISSDIRVVNIYPYKNGFARILVTDNNSEWYSYLNSNGVIFTHRKFISVTDFSLRGEAIVKTTDNYYRVLSSDGKLSRSYDELYFTDKGLIIGKLNHKYGIYGDNDSFIFDEIKNNIGRIVIKRGKYKGYEQYFYISNDFISAKYGKPIFYDSKLGIEKQSYEYPLIDSKGNSIFYPDYSLVYRLNSMFYGEILKYNRSIFIKGEENIDYGYCNNKDGEVYPRLIEGHKPVRLLDNRGNIIFSTNKVNAKDIIRTKKDTFLIAYNGSNNQTLYKLIDKDGKFIVNNLCYSIKVLDCNFIICDEVVYDWQTKHKKYNLYDLEGKKIETKHEYNDIYGEDDILVAEYFDNNEKKYVYIDKNANEIFDGVCFDNASLFDGDFAIAYNYKTCYESNSPYRYKEYLIINKNGKMIKLENSQILNYDFIVYNSIIKRFIGQYKNGIIIYDEELNEINRIYNCSFDKFIYNDIYGYISVTYLDKSGNKKYLLLDLFGNNVFKYMFSKYEYENYVRIESLFDYDETKFRGFDNISKLSDNIVLLSDGEEKILLDISHRNMEKFDLSNFEFLKNPRYTLEDARNIIINLSKIFNSSSEVLVDLKSQTSKDKSLVKRYALISKEYNRIIPYEKKISLLNTEQSNGRKIYSYDFDNLCLTLHPEFKKALKYFDLHGFTFRNVNVTGCDFRNVNTVIDPQIVYNNDISNCLFDDNSLADINLKGIKMEGTYLNERDLRSQLVLSFK